MNELADWLTRVERDQSGANQRPKDAATLILIDRSGPLPKVLLGRRHHGHKFMPGKFVFPGGRVERADRLVPVASALDPHILAKLMRRVRRPSAERARAIAVAAIREVFEETGLLLGRKCDGRNRPEAVTSRFTAADVQPDLAELHLIARAITPPRRPRRFDTRFFAADAQLIAHRVDGAVGPDAELVELTWLPIPQARELDMPTITKVVLIELEARVEAGLGHDLPVPFYRVLHRKFVREML